MNIDEYSQYDGLGLAALVRKKEVTPQELLDASLRTINKLNASLNAVSFVDEELALKKLENHLPNGPFKGVPFLIKDLSLISKDFPINMGSRFAKGSVTNTVNELMKRFSKAGLLTIGTTTTPEFAYSATTESVLYGPTRNPWHTKLSPGGSSGGAAVAVSSGMVPLAHGSDGGGSIRIPASCTGLVGLKPTRGRVPTGPFISEPLSGLSVEFALTKSIRDTAALLDCIAGPFPGSYASLQSQSLSYEKTIKQKVRPLRIAWTKTPASGLPVDEDCLTALDETVELLEDLGHTVIEDAPSYDDEILQAALFQIWTANIYHSISTMAEQIQVKPSEENIEAAIWKSYLYGGTLSAAQLLDAKHITGTTSYQIGDFFTNYDLLLSPTIASPPFKLGELNANDSSLSAKDWAEKSYRYVPFTNVFNVTGQPAISLPLGWNKASLPIGMQFTGKFGDEGTLLQLAAQLENAKPWRDKYPPLHASQ